MIIGVGIDVVEINRFASWAQKDPRSLERILKQSEIDYCLSDPARAAQRFAARFAAREALFKAIGNQYGIPFLTLCSATLIDHSPSGKPTISIKHPLIQHDLIIHLSLSHTTTIATALIVAER